MTEYAVYKYTDFINNAIIINYNWVFSIALTHFDLQASTVTDT